jgi:hypothetical protein
MKIILSLGLLLAAGQALACADIRLDTAGALASFPVFDQATQSANTDMNICYAATAAQLIDTYRASKPEAKAQLSSPTSPWWVAVNYSSAFKKENNPDVQFGEPDKALEALKTDGVCSQQDLFGDKPTEDIIRFHQMLKEFYQSVATKKQEDKDSVQKLESILGKVGFIKDPTALAEISIKAIQEKTFVLFLRTIFHGKCQGKVKTNSPYDVERIDAERLNLSDDKKEQIVTQTLEKSQPIEVSICSQVLRNPQYAPAADFKKCMRHSILVVGSRTASNGQCQYLVRDTYGPGSCQRKRNGEPWYHPSLECQNGQVWVPQEALMKNAWGMTRVSASVTAATTASSSSAIPAAVAAEPAPTATAALATEKPQTN